MRDLVTSNGEKAYCTVKFRGINQTIELIFFSSHTRGGSRRFADLHHTKGRSLGSSHRRCQSNRPTVIYSDSAEKQSSFINRIELHRTASCFFFCVKEAL